MSRAQGRAAAEHPSAYLISLWGFPYHHNTDIIITGFSVSQFLIENLLGGSSVRLLRLKLSLLLP